MVPVYPGMETLKVSLAIRHNEELLATANQDFVMDRVYKQNPPKGFADVQGTPYQSATDWLRAMDVASGYPDGSFRPESNITRAEFVALWVKLLGMQSLAEERMEEVVFEDIAEDAWERGFVNQAYHLGMLKGYPDGSFRSSRNISYPEVLSVCVNLIEGNAQLDALPWPENILNRARDLGLEEGIDISNEMASRGNTAIILRNAYEKIMQPNNK
jgi:S-layer homology domain